MSGPITFEKISQAVEKLRAAKEHWDNLPFAEYQPLLVNWRGGMRKRVDQPTIEAADALFELVNRMDIDPAAWPLVLEIDVFDDKISAWANDLERRPETTDPAGSDAVWNAYRTVLTELTLRTFKPPTPIPQMLAEGVGRAQIAKEYRLLDDQRRPDLVKLQEEITTPGTHIDYKTFKRSAQIKFEESTKSDWQARAARLGEVARRKAEASGNVSAWNDAPESIEELIRKGVDERQIVKMKRVSVEEVRNLALALNLPLGGHYVSRALRTEVPRTDEEKRVTQAADQMRIDGLNSHPELGDNKTARVIAMHADGIKPADISRALAQAFAGLTWQQVNKIIKDAEKASV